MTSRNPGVFVFVGKKYKREDKNAERHLGPLNFEKHCFYIGIIGLSSYKNSQLTCHHMSTVNRWAEDTKLITHFKILKRLQEQQRHAELIDRV